MVKNEINGFGEKWNTEDWTEGPVHTQATSLLLTCITSPCRYFYILVSMIFFSCVCRMHEGMQKARRGHENPAAGVKELWLQKGSAGNWTCLSGREASVLKHWAHKLFLFNKFTTLKIITEVWQPPYLSVLSERGYRSTLRTVLGHTGWDLDHAPGRRLGDHHCIVQWGCESAGRLAWKRRLLTMSTHYTLLTLLEMKILQRLSNSYRTACFYYSPFDNGWQNRNGLVKYIILREIQKRQIWNSWLSLDSLMGSKLIL